MCARRLVLPRCNLGQSQTIHVLLITPFLAAMALIPDDDDEELIEKAKANRKNRLQTEKVAEKEYAKTGGFADSEVVAVQVRCSSEMEILRSMPKRRSQARCRAATVIPHAKCLVCVVPTGHNSPNLTVTVTLKPHGKTFAAGT